MGKLNNLKGEIIMDKQKKQLEDYIDLKMKEAVESDGEQGEKALKEAMLATDKYIELTNARVRETESKGGKIFKIIEIGSTVLVIPLIDYFSKRSFVKMLCNFEKDYTFTTSAGRSLSSLFRFKK